MQRILTFLLALFIAAGAAAATLAGVTVPDTADVAGAHLVLNGVGLRTKVFFKIYVGGLYLQQKTDNADAIQMDPGPDRILMHMIYEVDKDQFSDAWLDGFKDNNPESFDALHDRVLQFIAYFGDSKKDDVITLDYLPGTGTQISWNGTFRGNIPGEDFHKALLRVFVGPKPPTEDLRDGLLGKLAMASSGNEIRG
jgi:hypothetical protein